MLLNAPEALGVRGVVHGFTTRAGGVSAGSLATLNLARRPGEQDANLRENWARVVSWLGAGLSVDDLALLSQVHGDRVVEVERGQGPLEPVAEADAAFTRARGVVLAVRAADCVPVLLAGPGVVGVAHAGWRGTVASVVPALVAAIAATGTDPSALRAAVGPCISGQAYEVGGEVVAALRGAGIPDDAFLVPQRPGDRRDRVDLRRAVRWQLERAGVGQIAVSDRCTATDPALYSHRRDGDGSGRFAGVIARVS
jgi:polyphenol oxidase